MLQAQVAVFDLDGTLFDTGPDLLRATNRLLAEEGVPAVDAAAVRHLCGRGAGALIRAGYALAGRAVDPERLPQLIERFVAFYAEDIAGASLPYPGLRPALDRLAAAGIRLAVCTNKREGLARRLLAATGFADAFAAVIGGDTFPEAKPHPRPLTEAISMAGGTTDTAVLIGDSGTDVATARAAGIPVIVVDFGFADRPAAELGADAVISHYDQLDAALKAVHPGFARS